MQVMLLIKFTTSLQIFDYEDMSVAGSYPNLSPAISEHGPPRGAVAGR